MKKNDHNTNLINSERILNKSLHIDQIKTTNVNILLNRVRLDKKRTLRKKIIFSITLASIVSLLAIYFII